jgi:hypothetical protein
LKTPAKGVYTAFRGRLRSGSDVPKMPYAKRRLCARYRLTRVVVSVSVVVLLVLAGFLPAKAMRPGSAPPTVRGKVTGWERLLPQVYVEASKPDAHRYTWREPSPTVKQDFRKLTANVAHDICVVAFGTGSAQPHEPVSVKIGGGRITPATIVLALGSRLSFRNADPFPHQLFEVNNPAWAANAIAPTSTRDWAALAAGLHVIRDELFPDIVMRIVIDPQAVEFAVPDREGAFSLPLPPGEYSLKAFFEGKAVGKSIDGLRMGERSFDLREALSVGGESK